jgi:hypothetical protein
MSYSLHTLHNPTDKNRPQPPSGIRRFAHEIALVLGLLALSFVPFVGWRSSVMQLTLRYTWLTLQELLQGLSRWQSPSPPRRLCGPCSP